ncbi:hypothetical protein BS17DRAFT_518555 [Gyrodon lividus]|nr:hypothetical protein BS17DRAFT_518555 [Gyrodon lividus]
MCLPSFLLSLGFLCLVRYPSNRSPTNSFIHVQSFNLCHHHSTITTHISFVHITSKFQGTHRGHITVHIYALSASLFSNAVLLSGVLCGLQSCNILAFTVE